MLNFQRPALTPTPPFYATSSLTATRMVGYPIRPVTYPGPEKINLLKSAI